MGDSLGPQKLCYVLMGLLEVLELSSSEVQIFTRNLKVPFQMGGNH